MYDAFYANPFLEADGYPFAPPENTGVTSYSSSSVSNLVNTLAGGNSSRRLLLENYLDLTDMVKFEDRDDLTSIALTPLVERRLTHANAALP